MPNEGHERRAKTMGKRSFEGIIDGKVLTIGLIILKILEFSFYLCVPIHKDMNFSGIIVGAAVFLSIGICHPAVIKMEYYFGKQSWWVWLVLGLGFSALSLFVLNDTLSTIIGGFAFSCLWAIHEMFLQEKRVLRGWFPENPARHEYYERRRIEMQGKL